MNTHEGYSKKKLSDTYVLLAGGGDKSLADFLGGIRISSSKIQYRTAADAATSWTDLITLVNTDENVKQTPKTDNANRPLMMINGGTSTGTLTSTSLFSTGIYANASTKMITASGFIKTGSSDSYVLLGGGGHKAVSDFATSGHNHGVSKTIWGNTYVNSSGNLLSVDDNLYITTGDTDKFIMFRYNSNNYAGASWRLLSRGTGSSDTNYFDIETGGSNSGTNTWYRVIRLTMDSRRVGINTDSVEKTLDINGITQIYQRGNDNTAFKNLLLIKQQNSTEPGGNGWSASNPSFGIGFNRYWTSGSSPYGETTCAGIYATVSSSWRGGLVFRTKYNETQGGTHDRTALRLRPDGRAEFPNEHAIRIYSGSYNYHPIIEDGAGRPGISISGNYPYIWLQGGGTSNTSHGATITLAAPDAAASTNGVFKAWTFGVPGQGATWMDLGYGTSTNPHAHGINNYSVQRLVRFCSSPYQIVISGTGNDSNASLIVNSSRASTWVYGASFFAPNMTTGHNVWINVGKANSTRNSFGLSWHHAGGDGSTSNYGAIEIWGVGNIQRWYANGTTWHSGQVQGAGFYHTSIGSNNYVLLAGGSYKAISDFATSGHTHSLSIATTSDASSISLAANTKYKLTAGGQTYVFTTPVDTNTWRGITDTYYAANPSSDISLSQKGSSDMFNLLTISRGRWSWGGNGNNQYCLIAEIDTSGGYINYPIIFELNGRSLDYTKLSILFVNLQSGDPALSYFHTDNVTSFYLYKSATSKWRLYGSAPDGVWAIINLVRVIGQLSSSVTVKMESVASLPTGYTLPTYGWNVNYANSAGAVAWANVSSKPATATRWPTWDEVTSKPLSGYSGNNGPVWGNYVPVKSDGVMEIGKYLDFHNSSNDGVDYAVRLMCQGNNQVVVNLPTSGGTLALTSQIPTKASWNYDDRYVASVSISGNKLRVNKNGSNTDLTIPYATSAGNADTLDGYHHSSFHLRGSIIDTHAEGENTIILGFENELFAFYKRGCTCTAYEVTTNADLTKNDLSSYKTGTTYQKLSENIFNGLNGYNQDWSYTGDNLVVFDLTMPYHFWSPVFFWSFGNGSWKPAKLRILSTDTRWSDKSYISKYSSDSAPAYGKVSVGGNRPDANGTNQNGIDRLRIVCSKFSRISQFGITDYSTQGLSTVYLSRTIDNSIYRSFTPAADNTYNIGTSSLRWKEVRAVNFYGAFNGNATSATKATQDSDGNTINSTYLKLSGGTITNNNFAPLVIRRNHTTNYAGIGFAHYSSGTTQEMMGYLAMGAKDGKFMRLKGSDTSKVYDILDSSDTYAAKSDNTDVAVTCGTSATLATINGKAVKIKVTNPDDHKVSVVKVEPTSFTTYYPALNTANPATAANYTLNTHANYYVKVIQGAAGTEGSVVLTLGNSTAKATAGNSRGYIILYAQNTKKGTFRMASDPSDDQNYEFNKGGTVLTSGNTYWGTTSSNTSPLTINGTAKTVSLSGHTHNMNDIKWPGGHNLITSATANGQEWSIDCTPGTYTGTYWQVWRAATSGIDVSGTMLKVDCDTGKVSAPYGFVGNLSGNASSATNASNLVANARMDYGWNGINYFNISAANQSAAKVNDTPYSSATWTHILRFNHGNNAGFYTDLAIPFNGNGIYYKRIANGSLQNSTINGGWVSVLDNLNSSVSKSGETLSVKINGTTLSLTNTWRGILNNLTSDSTTDSLSAAQGKALNAKFGSYLPLSGGTLTGNLSFSNSGTGFRGINYGTMGDNDQWRIGGAATGSNAGYMEIATADDGNEPIYVRQYTGVFSTLKRTATLLDGSGNTSFPGTVSASSFSGNVTGNCSGSAGSVAWANVTGKPDTFTPSTHNHNGSYSYAHQTTFAFNEKHDSNYVTFDLNNPAGAPDSAWYNGFVTTHNGYLSSYIINGHRSANWYVGYSENSTAPTWYKLIHSGNIGSLTVQEAKRPHSRGTVYNVNTVTDGIIYNYSSESGWLNAPSGMSYGSVLTINPSYWSGLNYLGLQLAWDVNHGSSTNPGKLWFRTSNDGAPAANNYWVSGWSQVITSAGGLTINGSLTASSFYNTSDIRTKKDISNISEHVRKFKFKKDNSLHYGFIALELEVEHPELVDNLGEYKTVDYNSALSLLLAKAENKIKELENRIKLLEDGKNS